MGLVPLMTRCSRGDAHDGTVRGAELVVVLDPTRSRASSAACDPTMGRAHAAGHRGKGAQGTGSAVGGCRA